MHLIIRLIKSLSNAIDDKTSSFVEHLAIVLYHSCGKFSTCITNSKSCWSPHFFSKLALSQSTHWPPGGLNSSVSKIFFVLTVSSVMMVIDTTYCPSAVHIFGD